MIEEQNGEFYFQIPYRPKIEVFVNSKDEISIFADEAGISIPLESAEQVAKAIISAAKEAAR